MTLSMGHYAEFIAPDMHRFRAFVARPSSTPRGALIVLHEMDIRAAYRGHSSVHPIPMPGLSQRIRSLVNEHAARGYLVLAPSLFGRGKPGRDHGFKYRADDTSAPLLQPLQPVDSSRVMMDVQTVVAWAQGQLPHGRVGVMGFCWGGLLAWQAACTLPQIFAATSFYGGGMTLPEERSGRPLCPVLVHFPSHGMLITSESMDAFEADQCHPLVARGSANSGPPSAMVQIERYDAAYGFDHAGSRQYDALASHAARLKTSAFFDKHLNF